nr:hypothetical protein [Tanacetum cinerariifolium]
MLPIELTNADIGNYAAYKEYYAVATRATPPKTKVSVRKTRSSSDTTVTPPTTTAGQRLSTSSKGKQPATTSKAKNEGTSTIPGVLDVPTDESEEEISWNSTDEEGDDDDDDEGDNGEEGNDDDDAQDHDDQKDEGNDEDDQKEETRDEESFDPILKTPENTDDEGNGEENLGMNVGREEGQDEKDEEEELYREVNINLGRGAVSSIPGIVHRYMDQRMNEAVKVAIQLQSNRLCDEAQKENDKFLKTIDENMQKIIKEQVKEQVKVQVSKILPKIGQTVNEQLEAEVLTRSSNSSKTSYAIVADLSEMELKKILIEKIKGNKSIHRSNE